MVEHLVVALGQCAALLSLQLVYEQVGGQLLGTRHTRELVGLSVSLALQFSSMSFK